MTDLPKLVVAGALLRLLAAPGGQDAWAASPATFSVQASSAVRT